MYVFKQWLAGNAMHESSFAFSNPATYDSVTERLCDEHGLDGSQGGFAIGYEYLDAGNNPTYYRFMPYAVNGRGKHLEVLCRLFEAGVVSRESPLGYLDEHAMAVIAALFPARLRAAASPECDGNLLALRKFQGSSARVRPVVYFSEDSGQPMSGDRALAEGWFRLMALSTREHQPHSLSTDGMFGALQNLVWCGRYGYTETDYQELADRADSIGQALPSVTGRDKFPAMVHFVRPSGVRVASGDRVRLGAHLAEGTTVMHEGFVNFNAGTLGASMVEGRISAGVVVGDGSDVGGGASIMGTLSGGGQEEISIGERCLLGANSGLGISLGNDCIIEAGLYLTAGTKITLPDGEVKAGRHLSGIDGLLFRRNSLSGAVEAVPNGVSWGGLNAALHAN